MTDCKIISILKKMEEEEKELICADFDTETTLGYTHGDKAEALNVAIFELENKDKFYIDKTVIEDKIEEYKHKDFIKMQVVMKHDKEALKIVEVLEELLGDE